MEILIKLSLSYCNNRCLLSQQNLDTNLTENEVTPKISLEIQVYHYGGILQSTSSEVNTPQGS